MNRVGITASRKGHPKLETILDASHAVEPITELILGCADGGDRQALEWAIANDVFFVVFTADWDAFGRSAGPKRNAKMVAHGAEKPHARFLGFPRAGSIGTYDCMRQAVEDGLDTYVVDMKGGLRSYE